jgi:hypothetical protein
MSNERVVTSHHTTRPSTHQCRTREWSHHITRPAHHRTTPQKEKRRKKDICVCVSHNTTPIARPSHTPMSNERVVTSHHTTRAPSSHPAERQEEEEEGQETQQPEAPPHARGARRAGRGSCALRKQRLRVCVCACLYVCVSHSPLNDTTPTCAFLSPPPHPNTTQSNHPRCRGRRS